MTRKLIGALAGACVLATCGTAQAGPVTFQYEGTVDYFRDDLGTLPSDIAMGADFSLSYTFESTAPEYPGWAGDPTFAFYRAADGLYYDFTIAIGGVVFTMNALQGGDGISVQDHAAQDLYSAGAQMQDAVGYASVFGGLYFRDFSHSAITGDALPLVAPDPEDFSDITRLQLVGYDSDFSEFFFVYAYNPRISQIVAVPEPSSLALFGAGLAVLGVAARFGRRRNQS